MSDPQLRSSCSVIRRVGRALWPSPSFVLAAAALFIALGGQTWATPSSPAATPRDNVTKAEATWKVSNGGVTFAKATCKPGTRVFSGGYASTGQHARFTVVGPSASTNSFLAYAYMPPVNINTGVGRETAEIKVLALRARAGVPVVFAPQR